MNRNYLHGFSLFAFLWILFCSGCAQQPGAPVYIKDGKQYGIVKSGTFRHRWWNYFERGLSYAEGKYYASAVADFEEAIRQRAEDQRRARTYGMHFIDYFPHRELGIVHFETGKLELAQKELALSLRQFPSAKAQFYLDRVRKQLIQKELKEIPPPRLYLDIESETFWTRDDPVILTGRADDDHFVQKITINSVPVLLPQPEKQISFEKKLSLAQGRHVIAVEAHNIVGGRALQQVTIVVDREGPLISIDSLTVKTVSSGKLITLAGALYDKAGVADLKINGRRVLIPAGTELSFSYELSTAMDELEFIAGDILGNSTTARILLTDLRGDNSSRPIYAGLSSDMDSFKQSAAFASQDTRAPEIILRGWTARQTVYLKKVYLEGQVKDGHQITALEINGKPILKRQGKFILFSQFIELVEGENRIAIRARDEKGHAAERIISIKRRIPRALQLAERMSLTVLPFDQTGDLTAASNSFQDFLIDALVNQNRFRLVERDKLDVILQEQKLSRTDLFDEKTAIKVGQLVAAQSLVAGSIIQNRLGSEIITRLIDTETADILAVVDVYDEVTSIRSLRSLSEGLALKLHREFPLIDGVVVQRKGDSIFSDLGRDQVKIYRRLIVFREEPVKHPVTGKALGVDNVILGRARITQVMPELSKADILGDKPATIKPLDKVITE
jgi:tetratricopeptide (TPR) repeat protein